MSNAMHMKKKDMTMRMDIHWIGSALTEKEGEVDMSRVVLYMIADNGWVVPIRRAYRKARYRKKMGRHHDWCGFHKNRR
jgi:hypothetical protein